MEETVFMTLMLVLISNAKIEGDDIHEDDIDLDKEGKERPHSFIEPID